MTHRLFVYGTLAPGRSNEHILAVIPGFWEPATVRGTLFPEGWRGDIWYPGIILSDDGDEVEGMIFTSEQLPVHWQLIDDFEGEGYRRVAVAARLRDGTAVEAFIYALADEASAVSKGG